MGKDIDRLEGIGTMKNDLISRRAAIDMIEKYFNGLPIAVHHDMLAMIHRLPSARPGQRYTEEELRVFAHGISLSLLSKRSAQHWRYDKDTAKEIEFLERLYDKVVADMGDEQDG